MNAKKDIAPPNVANECTVADGSALNNASRATMHGFGAVNWAANQITPFVFWLANQLSLLPSLLGFHSSAIGMIMADSPVFSGDVLGAVAQRAATATDCPLAGAPILELTAGN